MPINVAGTDYQTLGKKKETKPTNQCIIQGPALFVSKRIVVLSPAIPILTTSRLTGFT